MTAIDERALAAGARAVLHRRIKPDFFEVKDGAWTLDHDKVVAEAAIMAYLQALRPGSTGETEGWVLVPREPTEAMAIAGLREGDALGELIDWRGPDSATREDIRRIYRAMLAAAGGR